MDTGGQVTGTDSSFLQGQGNIVCSRVKDRVCCPRFCAETAPLYSQNKLGYEEAASGSLAASDRFATTPKTP